MKRTAYPACCVALTICLFTATWAEEAVPGLSPAAQTVLKQARQLLDQNDVSNAVILLESQRDAIDKDKEYAATFARAYQLQFEKLQADGKLAQAAQVWEKLSKLPASASVKETRNNPVEKNPVFVVHQQTPQQPGQDHLTAAQQAFEQGEFEKACHCYERSKLCGQELSQELKEQFAYCKLYAIARQLNDAQGQPGAARPQMEREVRAALELAPRLEFGRELLQRLQIEPKRINTRVKHLQNKEQGWSVCETEHFRVFHTDSQLGEQVAEIAETTRAAVIRRWLGHDVEWRQPCQIYVHPNADSYHRQSGMPATAPGHSDYDADKNDASNIHYRRVFVRADHAHMLSAILPHEVTHVVLNGQFGRRLLPRWADEGLAVLSEPYSRIGMHLEPLPAAYRENRALSLQELLTIEDYPQDRSKVASFYGQSVCLVEYLCQLKSPRAFVNFMRDANNQSFPAALQQHYGMTMEALEAQLQQWICVQQMPTLMKQTQAIR